MFGHSDLSVIELVPITVDSNITIVPINCFVDQMIVLAVIGKKNDATINLKSHQIRFFLNLCVANHFLPY